MYEIDITNFQSISHTNIVIDGFTTLIGQNSLGKSAVLRAINAAITNQQGTDFIKWGEKFCEVKIKCSAFDLTWHKETGNNYYKINGSKRTKVGKEEPPEELVEAGFKILKVGDQKINLNYISQFNPLFLIDRQDSKAADLLTSVYGLDILYDSIEICNSVQQENSNQLRIREKDLDLVDKDLEKFEGFEKIQDQIGVIESNKHQIDVTETELKKIQDWQKSLIESSRLCKKLKPVTEIQVPVYKGIQEAIAEYLRLKRYQERLKAASEAFKRLEGVPDVSVPKESVKSISDEMKVVERLKIWQKSYDDTKSTIDKLSGIQSIAMPESISVENLATIKSLKEKYSRLNKIKNEYIAYQRELEEVKVQAEEVNKEKAKFDRCPMCGGPLK